MIAFNASSIICYEPKTYIFVSYACNALMKLYSALLMDAYKYLIHGMNFLYIGRKQSFLVNI